MLMKCSIQEKFLMFVTNWIPKIISIDEIVLEIIIKIVIYHRFSTAYIISNQALSERMIEKKRNFFRNLQLKFMYKLKTHVIYTPIYAWLLHFIVVDIFKISFQMALHRDIPSSILYIQTWSKACVTSNKIYTLFIYLMKLLIMSVTIEYHLRWYWIDD